MAISFANQSIANSQSRALMGACTHGGCVGELSVDSLLQYFPTTYQENSLFSTSGAVCKKLDSRVQSTSNNLANYDFEQNSSSVMKLDMLHRQQVQELQHDTVATSRTDFSDPSTLVSRDAAVSVLLQDIGRMKYEVDFVGDKFFDDSCLWSPSNKTQVDCSTPSWGDRENMGSFSTTASVPLHTESMSPLSTTRESSSSSGTQFSPRNLDGDCRVRNVSFNKEYDQIFDVTDLDNRNCTSIANAHSSTLVQAVQQQSAPQFQLPNAHATSKHAFNAGTNSFRQYSSLCAPSDIYGILSSPQLGSEFNSSEFSKSYSDGSVTSSTKDAQVSACHSNLLESYTVQDLRHLNTCNDNQTTNGIAGGLSDPICNTAHGDFDSDVAALTLLSYLLATCSNDDWLESNRFTPVCEPSSAAVKNIATNGHNLMENLEKQFLSMVVSPADECTVNVPTFFGPGVLPMPPASEEPILPVRASTNFSASAAPAYPSVDMPSLLLHEQGRCKPCAFHYNRKKGCRNGSACEFCHHEDHSKLTLKQWKKQQQRLLRVQNRGRGVHFSPDNSYATNQLVNVNQLSCDNSTGRDVGTQSTFNNTGLLPGAASEQMQQYLGTALHQQLHPASFIPTSHRAVGSRVDGAALLSQQPCLAQSTWTTAGCLKRPPPPALPMSGTTPPAAVANGSIATTTPIGGFTKGPMPYSLQQQKQQHPGRCQQQHSVTGTNSRKWVWQSTNNGTINCAGLSRLPPPPPPTTTPSVYSTTPRVV